MNNKNGELQRPTNEQPIILKCCSSRNPPATDIEQYRKKLQEKREQLKNLKLKISQLMAINARLQKELKKLKSMNLKRKRATVHIMRYLEQNFMVRGKRSPQYVRRKAKILYNLQPYRYLLVQGFGLPATERILFKRIMKVFKNCV
ncbi:uncharacterized protein LOC119074804 [Bradysia coprophila]|uniref:uncharacterized protein LOC119074804 n=1 Tax=Bradysia coprophila TaxID=38358 RepID=UPI00187D6FF2|nr:uncharacterized protein LOC119074804 [Bradysia coprophila]